MNEDIATLPGRLVTADTTLAREFEARLADSSSLAFRVAYGVLRNHADAEDVAQEAFVRAFRRFQALRDRERFRAWLVRMTWRLALDWKRGHGRRSSREDAVARTQASFGDAEADMAATERSTRLWLAIDTLPERLRIVIILSAIEGYDVREVAALVGVPAGTVKSRLFEARKQLQERLR